MQADATVLRCAGPLATERALLAALAALADEARGDRTRLAQPVRVVVPSRSLRVHLASEAVRAEGGALLGVQVQTLRSLALELLQRAGAPARSDALLGVLVRRAAAAEPELAAALGPLADGYGAVAGAVSDLLDAGLTAAQRPALEDALEAAAPHAPAVRRARALARVAVHAAEALAAAGGETRAALFARAAAALRERPERLPARAVLIHGYADATGTQLDLLQALCEVRGARVFLDLPRDPADPARPAPGLEFLDRLRARLDPLPSGDAAPAPERAAAREPPSVLAADGSHAELRAVAERIRAALDDGIPPERIGVVARDLAPYRTAISTQLRRLAIPFHGGRAGMGPARRASAGLLALLERGPALPVARWLDVCERFAPERREALRLGLHASGVARLRELGELDVKGLLGGESRLRLPAVRGLAEEEGATRVRRRSLDAAALEAARAAAAEVLAAAGALADAAALAEQLERVRELARRALGWSEASAGSVCLARALASVANGASGEFPLAGRELLPLLRRALERAAEEPLGGAGGGVAVLSVTEARARSFERLFVVGLTRDGFPRSASEDALLPEWLRLAVEPVLPDIPLKARRHAEERYLFAQLCGAAPQVALSWPAVSDQGRERAISPLLQRLAGDAEPESAPHGVRLWRSGPGARAAAPWPAAEHAIAAALADRDAAPALALALRARPAPDAASAAAAARVGAEALAHVRCAVVAELEGRAAHGERFGPYQGFVGGAAAAARGGRVHVTRLEALARCAWRSFLEHDLGIEPVPDAFAAPPDAEPRFVGSVVHEVLEQLAVAAGVPAKCALDALDPAAAGLRVPWPPAEELEARVAAAARRLALKSGSVHPARLGRVRALACQALDALRETEAPDGGLHGVLGAEVTGVSRVAGRDGRPRELFFRADRVDRADGALRLTDYKTASSFSTSTNLLTVRGHVLGELRAGTGLQAAAYADGAGAASRGRYVYPKGKNGVGTRVIELAAADDELANAYRATVAALFEAWELGARPPRLWPPGRDAQEEGPDCGRCAVRDACLQGETSQRWRLYRVVAADGEGPDAAAPAERAARELLRERGPR